MDLPQHRAAFEYVEQIEHGLEVVPADLTVVSGSQADDEGTALMLLETQHDFASSTRRLTSPLSFHRPSPACSPEPADAKLAAYAAAEASSS